MKDPTNRPSTREQGRHNKNDKAVWCDRCGQKSIRSLPRHNRRIHGDKPAS